MGTLQAVVMRRYVWMALRRPMLSTSAYASCLPQIPKKLASFPAVVQALQAQP